MWTARTLRRALFGRPAPRRPERFVPALVALEDRSQPAVLIPASAAVPLPPGATPGLNGEWYDRNDPAGFLVTFARADAVVRNDPVAATFRATTAAYGGPGSLATLLGPDAASLTPASAGALSSSPMVIRLRGFITIDPSHDTVPGNGTIDVRFAFFCDDDARLRIGGQTVLTAPSLTRASETASFEAAGSYPVEVTWFDHFGGIFFNWWSSIPGGPSGGAPAGTVGLVPTSVLRAAATPAGVFTVTNTNDSGAGSLRQAILDANAAPTAAEIRFQIPTTDPNFADVDSGLPGGDPAADVAVIRPLSALPAVTNPRGVRIDARTQTTLVGNTNPFGPEVVLDGSLAGPTADGLSITSDGNAVFGLNVQRWGGQGIAVIGGQNNWIAANYVGTNATGTAAAANTLNGIRIFGAAKFNVVGTNGDGISDDAEWNLLSGNGFSGVTVTDAGSDNNVVAGNRIGTDRTGTTAVPNSTEGVHLRSANNRVGTNADGVSDILERNLISGNAGPGVRLSTATSVGNAVAGNYIGTNLTGTGPLANGTHGVLAHLGASGNRIGTDGNGVADAAEANLISGNALDGVQITGVGTDATVVAGNLVGTNAAGTASIGNGLSAVAVFGGPQDTRVGTDGSNDAFNAAERNVLSGNADRGVFISDANTLRTIVAGNFIGTNAAGTAAIGNGTEGVRVQNGAKNTRIGTDGNGTADDAEGNVISGNAQNGVMVTGAGTDDTVVAGNWIGTNAGGTAAIGNGWTGVGVLTGPARTRVGTDGDGAGDAAERNVISGNNDHGVAVGGAAADTVVAGNYIGTNPDGVGGIPNTIGFYAAEGTAADALGVNNGTPINGAGYGSGKVGRAFELDGVDDAVVLPTTAFAAAYGALTIEAWVFPRTAHPNQNVILSRTDLDGFSFRLANGRLNLDLRLTNGNRNVVFGTTAVPLNTWSHVAATYDGGTIRGYLNGVLIGSAAASGTIRTAQNAGTATMIGNEPSGTAIQGPGFAFDGRIDELGVYDRALTADELNRIVASGANGRGVAVPFGNRLHGVFVLDRAVRTRIGTDGNGVADAAEGNLISGNGSRGVAVTGVGTDDTVVAGNRIGTTAAGTALLGNPVGLDIDAGAKRTRVGTNGDGVADAAERNVIASNGGRGIGINGAGTDGNVVAGNYIGTAIDGVTPLGRFGDAVWIVGGARNNRVGTNGDGIADAAERNVIGNATFAGVALYGGNTDGNVVAGNYIGVGADGNTPIGSRWGVAFGYPAPGDGPQGNRVGTNGDGVADAAEGNVISGNGVGVRFGIFGGGGITGNVVAGNVIGLNATGTAPVGNGSGVEIAEGAAGNRIGTDGNGVADATERNVIAGNAGRGVVIDGPGSVGNAVRGNSLFANAGGAIDLTNGGNLERPAPVLAWAVPGRVAGTATGPADSTLTIDLYANPATDNPAQARRYLGAVSVTTDAAGNAAFAAPVSGLALGERVTATATDAAGNTSELSAPAAVARPVAVESVVVNDGAVQRSMVSKITVTFTGRVTVAAGAFALTRRDGLAVALAPAVTELNGRTVVELTFAGTGQAFGSLADGRYTLTIDPDLVRDADLNTALDGDGDGAPGGGYANANQIHRLFGDLTGDAAVDATEMLAFRRAFGSVIGGPLYDPLFDFDGNGRIDAADRDEIFRRFGPPLPP